MLDEKIKRNNIISEAEAKRQIAITLDQVEEALSKTLGPYGSTTIVQDRTMQHFMTKDGYTVLKNMYFEADIPSTILDLIKKISRRLVREVGDGSTSSVLISKYMYEGITAMSKNYKIAPQDIIDILNKSIDIFEKYIRELSFEVTEENYSDIISKVATISLNNDKETGKFLTEVFNVVGRYGFINLLNSASHQDTYEIVNGIEIYRGFLDMNMATDKDKNEAIYDEEVKIFMCNDYLDDSDMDMVAQIITEVCINDSKPLLIIAEGYSESFYTFFHTNLIRHAGTLPLVAIDMGASTTADRNRFEDLAISVSCDYYNKAGGELDITADDILNNDRLGVCKSIVVSDLNTRIIEGQADEEKIARRIELLEEEYEKKSKINDHIDRDMELFELKKRIGNLKGNMANLYVGGYTEDEKETRKFLMEDAVYACRSVIENGYVIGGNLILPRVIHKYKSKIIEELITETNISHYVDNYKNLLDEMLEIIKASFLRSFKAVLKNAYIQEEKEITDIITECIDKNMIYNVKTKQYEHGKECNVINSCNTDIEIMKTTFSLITLLALSNQFISVNIPK